MDNILLPFFNQTLANPILDVLMIAITLIGNPVYHVIAIPVLWLLIKPFRKLGSAIWVTYLVTLGLTLFMQLTVLRPRPDPALIRLIWPQPGFPSYPSGHASCAFAIAVFLGLYFRSVRVWVMAFAWAVLVGFSRLYLGHHYFNDVLGGAMLGAGLGATMFGLLGVETRCIASLQRIASLRSRIHWLLCIQIAIALVVTQMAYLDLIPWRYLSWPFADKFFHTLLFGAITFWLNLWLRGRTLRVGRWQLPMAIVIPFLFALSEECLQLLSPYRTFDVFDLSCDLLGMTMAWWLSTKWLSVPAPPNRVAP